MKSVYPENWKELSLSLRANSDAKCERCGRQCLKPGEVPKDRHDSYSRRLNPHHKDRDRSNCEPDNIEMLCPGCHLLRHRAERRGARYHNGQLELFKTYKKAIAQELCDRHGQIG